MSRRSSQALAPDRQVLELVRRNQQANDAMNEKAFLALHIFLSDRVVVIGWGFAGFIMFASMAGLLVGGVLDRLTEAIIAQKNGLPRLPQALNPACISEFSCSFHVSLVV